MYAGYEEPVFCTEPQEIKAKIQAKIFYYNGFLRLLPPPGNWIGMEIGRWLFTYLCSFFSLLPCVFVSSVGFGIRDLKNGYSESIGQIKGHSLRI